MSTTIDIRPIDILPKGGQKVHQTLDREVAGLPAHQTGNVRLSNAQYRAGLGLRESSVLDQAVDLQREARFELLTLGVGKTEVGKDVAAALFNSNLVLHLHLGSSPYISIRIYVYQSRMA